MRKLHLIWALPTMWVLILCTLVSVALACAFSYPAMRLEHFIVKGEGA